MAAAHSVPRKNPETYAALVGWTDAFCERHLNDEYKALSREMAAVLCDQGPELKGKLVGWAAGIVNALGWVNFLGDASLEPHMRQEEVARGFGVSAATMHAKTRIIREGFDLVPLDPRWTLPSRMDDNPMIWMLKVNGMIVDIRGLPRAAQVVAFEKGLIPYVPADREGADSPESK
ncbi:MAG: DUF6398 domain-containing protein [Phycisphaerae bacterium]